MIHARPRRRPKMRALLVQLLDVALRRFRREQTDPFALMLLDIGLTHGEREALLALRREP